MANNKKHLLTSSLVVLGFALSGQAGASTVIFSNFNGQPIDVFQPGTIVIGLGVEGAAAGPADGVPLSFAAAFTADNSYSLAQLDLGFLPPSLTGSQDTSVVVSLQSNLSGLPGGALSSWTEDVPANGLLTLHSTGVSLIQGEQYFLTVEANDPLTNVAWSMAGSSSTAPLFYNRGQGWLPTDATLFPAGTYPLLSQFSLAFDAIGNPAPVPLPAGLWLLASGLLGLRALKHGNARRTVSCDGDQI